MTGSELNGTRIGVVGAGTMGSGIAQALATSEAHDVVLCDVSVEFAECGKRRIADRLTRRVRDGKLDAGQADLIKERIRVTEIDSLTDRDLIVEAVVEEMTPKRSLFKRLDQIAQPDTVFASNTSSLSVTELGHGLGHALVGMHFFNPAPVMRLVEVIAGADTPSSAVQTATEVAERIGKTPVEVNEAPGFVVNRILIPMINEAVGVLADDTASAEDIDTAMVLGANLPMGPLALGDLVGLDVVLAIMEVLQSETGDSKYRPHPLLRKLVRANRLGKKTGQGFFVYP